MVRSSGILMPLSSLPSPYGIGTLGKEAFRFVDFLANAGQRYWQLLPVGPTSFGDSPYQSFTTFGGNPYFIDLELLIEDGLLEEKEVSSINWGTNPVEVNYDLLYRNRRIVLKKAFDRGWERDRATLATFEDEQEDWLPEYALYMSVKQHFGMKSWTEWPDPAIRMGEAWARETYRNILDEEVRYHTYLQFLFFSQWKKLKHYANIRGVNLIGDLPFYVPLDSADVWGTPENYRLDQNRIPVAVGGVPPDGFTDQGQMWGNPLYDWDTLKKDGYHWWSRRARAAAQLFDAIRIDHFRGIESYWEIPWGADSAAYGEWRHGPGMDLIRTFQKACPGLEIIAEDLGHLTERVRGLRKASGYPGMRVIQFAFDFRAENEYLPHNYERNCVVYTGTHDNNTIIGWLSETSSAMRAQIKKYFGLTEEEGLAMGVIRGGMSSVADLFITQMQDYLGLDAKARMNIPGTLGGNWLWRLTPGQLKIELAVKIKEYTAMYGR